MTHSTSLIRSAPRYSILRKISVVMIKQFASGLMETSPVNNPTSNPSTEKSRNFWLLMVLIGDVYIARVACFVASANAYSAHTVFPALVCAATKTDSPRSIRYAASFWKSSNSNLNCLASVGTSARSFSSMLAMRSMTHHVGFVLDFSFLEVFVFPEGKLVTRNTSLSSKSESSPSPESPAFCASLRSDPEPSSSSSEVSPPVESPSSSRTPSPPSPVSNAFNSKSS
mmetsp:Transcript_5260/g.19690  ORF Transcript_5260/g.19690 Transcript_5260/m.19690 type:complete len:227 (+) Transcript_5260:2013-2693(+)